MTRWRSLQSYVRRVNCCSMPRCQRHKVGAYCYNPCTIDREEFIRLLCLAVCQATREQFSVLQYMWCIVHNSSRSG